MSFSSYLALGQKVWYGFYIFSLVLSSKLLSATTSELCIEPPSSSDTSSSFTCSQSCGFVTSQAHKMCVKGDIICIPANYSKFELPNQFNATEVNYYLTFASFPITNIISIIIVHETID